MEQTQLDRKLFRAVEKGDITAVQELLLQGANVNARLGPQGKGMYPGFTPSWMTPMEMAEWTPLMAAVNRGFIKIVHLLLEHGAEIEATESGGLTALSHAARAGQLKIARLLLLRGASIHARQPGGKTMLHLAAWQGQNTIIELLIDHGMDVNVTDESGDTALHCAARWYGHIETVRLLVRRGANIQAETKSGVTALWEALQARHSDIVVLLLEAGVHPSLKEAAVLGDVHAGQQWIAAGADINAPVWGRMTPLALACKHGQAAFARLLIEKGATLPDGSILYDTVRSGSLETVHELLSVKTWSLDSLREALLGALFDEDSAMIDRIALQIEDWEPVIAPVIADAHEGLEGTDFWAIYLMRTRRITVDEKELLHLALRVALWSGGCPGNQHAERVQSLLEFGVECTYSLPYAVREGCSTEILQMLLQYGADLNALYRTVFEPEGQTAMQIALDDNNVEAVRFLIEAGASINLTEAVLLVEEAWVESLLRIEEPSHADLNAALWKAVAKRHANIVRRLLSAGADPNKKQLFGRNVLWEAVYEGCADLYQLLIEHGAKIEPDINGMTLLHMAAIHDRIDIAQMLLETDISLDAIDEDGNTAWNMARINGNFELADLIEQRQAI